MQILKGLFRVVAILLIVAYFGYGGALHFIDPEIFMAIMPPYLPYHLELVWISGAFELLGALGLLIPKTRAIAGYGLIALTLAVTPANIHMAMNPDLFPDVPVALLYVRLVAQVFLIWLIWFAAGGARAARRAL
jgi:uncharacterized membrane protein